MLGTSVALLAASALPALAAGKPAWQPRPFEANVSNDVRHEDGEPSIAVNPRNPKNIILIYLRNNDFFVPNAANGQHLPEQRDLTQHIQGCDYAVTFDGGKTWTRHPLPANDPVANPAYDNCSDSIVVFDKQGVAHVMAAAYSSLAFAASGQYRYISSRDGGRSWSKPLTVAPGMVGPEAYPEEYGGLRTYDDRPWLTHDDSTRTLYIDGTQVRIDGDGAGFVYLTSYTHGQKRWSDPIVIPTGPLGSAPLGAAFGMVALVVSPPPNTPTSDGCPADQCYEFVYSTDRARTVKRIATRIPTSDRAQTVADPTRKGVFYVMVPIGAGKLSVYRTPDAGKTWSKPASFGVPNTSVVKPWLAISPTGVVGAGWRAERSDRTYDFWAAVSYDKAKTFSKPIRLSRAVSPPAPPYYAAGDDTSTVALSKTHLYAAWGDWRGGHLEDIWWGGFALAR